MIPEFGIVRESGMRCFTPYRPFVMRGLTDGDEEPYSSLTSYTGNGAVNVIVMVLIVVGGIGFLTWG